MQQTAPEYDFLMSMLLLNYSVRCVAYDQPVIDLDACGSNQSLRPWLGGLAFEGAEVLLDTSRHQHILPGCFHPAARVACCQSVEQLGQQYT